MAADKTNNHYKIAPDAFEKLLEDNITADYKKSEANKIKEIQEEALKIAKSIDLDDRILKTSLRYANITLKDHKENPRLNPKCRLLNATKPELGKVSKHILTKIIKSVRTQTQFNQWVNTDSVIKWFNQLDRQKKFRFIQFDIVAFYPSISEDLLRKSLDWASNYIQISNEEREIIFHAKKSILFFGATSWVKRSNPSFDVGMGSFDGAENCDLVGLFLLSQLQHLPINIGLYRDDGLAATCLSTKQCEDVKKEIGRIFHLNNLSITIEANKNDVNFLDINMDLDTWDFKPFRKPNNNPQYIHVDSNHPPSITKNIPLAVNKRLNEISSNKAIFDAASKPYQEALKEGGYKHILAFEPNIVTGEKKKKCRNRKVSWFNPPFCKNVASNVARDFLLLVDSCFPVGHVLRSICNRNTIKVSYRTMPNMTQLISRHNSNVLNVVRKKDETDGGCNCQVKAECPLKGNGQIADIIYQATVSLTSDPTTIQTYIGLAGGQFKTIFYSHMEYFRHTEERSETTLSQYIWKLNNNNSEYLIIWRN